MSDSINKITPDMIENFIESVHYFTAADGRAGAMAEDKICYEGKTPVPDLSPLNLVTFCVVILKNGFTLTGQSACADPANFDAEMGRKIARANALSSAWPVMGYALRNQLTGSNGMTY